ncbi:MAG: hypothetical protein ACLQUS_14790 [Desulfobaccales bacterium]
MEKLLFNANGITSYGSGGEEDFNLTGGIDTNPTDNQDIQKRRLPCKIYFSRIMESPV